jgi:hypothetical protein
MDFPTIIEKPKVSISPEILKELKAQIHEQGQVVVHCIQEVTAPMLIRIWPTTFLYDHHSAHKSDLVHAENICYFPQWKAIDYGENSFTLIFSGLPKSCTVFDLIEHCDNESGAFKVLSITRTDSDVYYVRI